MPNSSTENIAAKKIYKQYNSYIQSEEQNILSEPDTMYATAFNDMVTIANYDKDYAAGLLDVSLKKPALRITGNNLIIFLIANQWPMNGLQRQHR